MPKLNVQYDDTDGAYELNTPTADGVTSLNTLTGDVVIANGTNTTVTRTGQTLRINVPTMDAPGATVKKTFIETLLIAALNVLPPLTFTPSDTRNFWLRVNGVAHTPVSGAYSVDADTKTITLTVAGDYGVKPGWTVEAEYYIDPVIISFAPGLATAGTPVVITGANFGGTAAVKVNGANVRSFTIDSPTQITAIIAKTNATGTIAVQNERGTATSAAALTIDQILPFARSGRTMNALVATLNGRMYTASSVPISANAFSAFNNNVSNRWLATGLTNQRLVIRFPFRLKISQYTIRHASGNTSNYPRDWTIEGSNDGISWTVLDTKTLQPIVASQTVIIPLTDEYEYYSINIAQAQSALSRPAISELVFDIIL
jgi:hypothetical protein